MNAPARRRTKQPPFDAKGVLTSERRRLSRLATRRRQLDAQQARLALSTARQAAEEAPRTGATVATALAGMLRTVAASWGLDVRFEITHAEVVSATASIDRVRISHPSPHITSADGALSVDRLRAVVADVKGIGYHEVGHLRYTVAFATLARCAGRAALDVDLHQVARARAVLEDQRMEARMVADSPVLGSYFATTVIRHLTRYSATGRVAEPPPADWLLVAGRAHVPSAVRDSLRASFVSARGEAHAATAERLIAAYRTATTPDQMWRIATEFAHFVDDDLDMLMPMPGLGDERRDLPSEDAFGDTTGTSRPSRRRLVDQVTRSLSVSVTPHASTPDTGTHEQPGPTPGDSPGAAQEPEPIAHDTLAELLRHELQGVEQSRLADRSIDDTVAHIVRAIDTEAAMLPRRRSTPGLHPATARKADLAAQLMVEALSTCTAHRAPMWQARQERGVLDPFAFRTRQPGARDHFRACVGDGDRSTDIAVSLVLDVSGSMQAHGGALGAAAYACKYACDQLSIPCTVTLFAGRGYLLWNVHDEPEHLTLRTEGTTDPTEVCATLDEQRHGRALHLVLMLTDGEFDKGVGGLDRYWAPDRAIVLIGLGAAVARAHATTTGVHEVLSISSVLDLPRTVTNVLTSLV